MRETDCSTLSRRVWFPTSCQPSALSLIDLVRPQSLGEKTMRRLCEASSKPRRACVGRALARPSAYRIRIGRFQTEVHICKFIKCGWASAVTGAFRIEILSGARSGCQCVVEARSENRIGVLALTVPVRWSMHGSIDRSLNSNTVGPLHSKLQKNIA